MSVKLFFQDLSDILDQGWLSRIALATQFYLVFKQSEWTWAYASTGLASHADLMAVAAVITAVAAAPQALLMLAVNKYVELRNGNRT